MAKSPKSPKVLGTPSNTKVTGSLKKVKTPNSSKKKSPKSDKLKSPKSKKVGGTVAKDEQNVRGNTDMIKSGNTVAKLRKGKKDAVKTPKKLKQKVSDVAAEKAVKGKKIKAPKPSKPNLKKAKVHPDTEISDAVSNATRKAGTFGSNMEAIKTQAKKAVGAILEYSGKQKQNALFTDLSSRILLNIVCFKTPTIDQEFFNILLPHPLHSDDADVVLVIKHDKKKDEEDYQEDELKSSLFKQKLQIEHGIKVREVLTLKQLRSEYSTVEAKRAFIKRIDALLVDKSIIKHVPSILGREMYRKKKFCMPVNMANGRDIATEIQTALKKTVLHISSKGTTSTLVIGTDELTADQLTENVIKVCQNVSKNFPGGWPNISKLAIEALGLPPFNIYFSSGGPQDVTKPVKKSRKLREIVEDEISTQPNKRVKIHPDGAIFIRQVNEDEVA